MHFWAIEKNYSWRETGTRGGLIDPLGTEDTKRTVGVENLAGGSTPSTPVNSHPAPLIYSDSEF